MKGEILLAKKYYAVKKGRKVGVFKNEPGEDTWNKVVKPLIHKYPGAQYAGFNTEEEAIAYLEGDGTKESNSTDNTKNICKDPLFDTIDFDYYVYTDGSYKDGKYSYGIVWVDAESQAVVEVESGLGTSEAAASMRNVAGELAGVMRAALQAEQRGEKICIVHDYTGVMFWARGLWKTKNEFTKKYKEFMEKRSNVVAFQWIKGHSGQEFNEMADRLAKEVLGIQ